MEYFIKEGWQLNPNEKIVKAITKRINICDGECPCSNPGKTRLDRICPCLEYRKNNICHCQLYIKKEIENE